MDAMWWPVTMFYAWVCYNIVCSLKIFGTFLSKSYSPKPKSVVKTVKSLIQEREGVEK